MSSSTTTTTTSTSTDTSTAPPRRHLFRLGQGTGAYEQPDFIHTSANSQPQIVFPELYFPGAEAAARAKDEEDRKNGIPLPQLVKNRPGVEEHRDELLEYFRQAKFKVAPDDYPLRAAFRTEPCLGFALIPYSAEDSPEAAAENEQQKQQTLDRLYPKEEQVLLGMVQPISAEEAVARANKRLAKLPPSGTGKVKVKENGQQQLQPPEPESQP